MGISDEKIIETNIAMNLNIYDNFYNKSEKSIAEKPEKKEKKKNTNLKITNFYITEEKKLEISKLAKFLGISSSEIVRYALKEHIDQHINKKEILKTIVPIIKSNKLDFNQNTENNIAIPKEDGTFKIYKVIRGK